MPAHGVTVQEFANAPKGCLEIEPAAIPPEFLHVLADVKEADTMHLDNGVVPFWYKFPELGSLVCFFMLKRVVQLSFRCCC